MARCFSVYCRHRVVGSAPSRRRDKNPGTDPVSLKRESTTGIRVLEDIRMNPDSVKKIPMYTIMERLEYDPDSGVFRYSGKNRPRGSRFKEGDIAGNVNSTGRVIIEINNTAFYAHRLAWEIHNGPIPYGMMIDHIDGNPSNNRLANLRVTTRKENAQNQRRAHCRNSTGVLGVSRAISHGRYIDGFYAHIRVNDRLIHLGTFATKEAAGEAYIRAKRIYHEGCTI